MKNKNLSLGNLPEQLRQVGAWLYRYRVMLFFLFLASLYGFILLQINSLSQAEPTAAEISAQKRSLKVDPAVVQKIEQLKDNSVSVQTLFDAARNNPFHE